MAPPALYDPERLLDVTGWSSADELRFASRLFRSLPVDAQFPGMSAAEMSQFGNNVI